MRHLWAIALSASLTGCLVADVNVIDPDSNLGDGGGGGGDTKKDSDNDGWTDAEEDASFTDPDDPLDHPYTGGWPIGSCRHDLEPTGGVAPGDIIDDYTFDDQYGEQIHMHDFCDKAILAVAAAEW